MKSTLAVAAREIVEKKLVLLGTLFLGLIPLAMPLLPGLGGAQARDARFVTALFLSLTIFVAFPIVFGATVLVSDIAQKRIAFYLSRPLPAVSIWAGKMLAAFVISVCGACIVAVPTILFDGKRAFDAFNTSGPATAYFLLTTLLLLVGAHTVSSMARLRSAWIALDFCLAALFGIVIALSLRGLFLAGFWNLYEMKHSPEWLLWWLAAPLIATLLASSYVQVADGRTDARRSHGALSATLWGLTSVFAAILGGLAWWVNAATPKDLVAIREIQVAPRGAWVKVSGQLRARGSAAGAFLYDTEKGRFIKRAPLPWYAGGVVFSADGARAVWLEERVGFFGKDRTADVYMADLSSAKALQTGLACSGWCGLAFSPSGRRLAVLDGDAVAAYDVSDPVNPKQLLAIRAGATSRTPVFVDEDTLRFFPRLFNANRKLTDRDLEIEEISVLSKKSLVTGRLEREQLLHLRISANGRYLVGAGEKRLTFSDGRTGALLETLSEELEHPSLRFFSAGRMAVAGLAEGKGVLKIFLERERTPVRSIDLGSAASLVLGDEIVPGRLIVALNPFRSNDETARKAWKLAVADIANGKIDSQISGLVPADRFAWWFSPVLPPAEAGSPASKLFLNASGALVRLDPATGAQTVLLGRSK